MAARSQKLGSGDDHGEILGARQKQLAQETDQVQQYSSRQGIPQVSFNQLLAKKIINLLPQMPCLASPVHLYEEAATSSGLAVSSSAAG